MNDTPTSGPIRASITHQARDASSSRHSFSINQANGALRKLKENFFKTRRMRGRRRDSSTEFLDGTFADHAAAAQEDETIADASRVADLMNRKKQRASRRGMVAERGADL